MAFSVLVLAALHVLTMDCPVSEPDEGFVLGNGDLSVCTYQTSDTLVFRFGKGDVEAVIDPERNEYGRLRFKTEQGKTYRLKKEPRLR